MSTESKQSEAEAIFGSAQIGGYTAKPWTIMQLVNLTPVLKYLVEALKKEGLDLSETDIDDFAKDLGKDANVADILSYITKGIETIGPVIPQIISISVRIDKEKAEEIEWGVALALTAKIIVFNWDHIKNWLGQILGKDPKTLFLALTKKAKN